MPTAVVYHGFHTITSLAPGLCFCLDYAMQPGNPGKYLSVFSHQVWQLSLGFHAHFYLKYANDVCWQYNLNIKKKKYYERLQQYYNYLK